MHSAAKPGVTVAICAHNAAERLQQTLEHLIKQVAPGVEWEVLLVDNASTDKTAEAAMRYWPVDQPAQLRVIHEPELGVANARRRAIREACYEYVTFVDDDNWVAPNWVALVFETFRELPEVGALGGLAEPASAKPLPEWFEQFQENYAIGSQAQRAGEVSPSRGYLFGAGLTLRKGAILDLYRFGFQSQVTGRQGTQLSAGDDNEICRAVLLAGWQLWYEPRLRLKHFMPETRLQWSYLRALWRGFGEADPILDAYRYAPWPPQTARARLGQTWWWRAIHALKEALWTHGALRWRKVPCERLHDEMLTQFHWQRFRRLVHMRSEYDALIREVRSAPWIRAQ